MLCLDCPFNVAAQRDQKGHYSKALSGQITNFFDVDVPYETPVNYEIKIDSAQLKPQEILKRIGDHFNRVGILSFGLEPSSRHLLDTPPLVAGTSEQNLHFKRFFWG